MLSEITKAHQSESQPVEKLSTGFVRPERLIRSIVSEEIRTLEASPQDEPSAAVELLPLVYDELRRLAAHKMASEASGYTLQPTALVHEAWLRLSQNSRTQWQNRDQFYAMAAETMRRILVDRARRRHARKHG